MRPRFFVDTWAYRALADRRDPFHAVAGEKLAQRLTAAWLPVTSNYVLDEALTGIRMRAGVEAAVRFGEDVNALAAKGALSVEWVDPARADSAWMMFQKYRDIRDLSFTDCTSFTIMRELLIDRVLSGDAHFEQVNLGFERL